MELRSVLAGILVLAIIVTCIDARKSSFGSSVRRGGSSGSRGTSKPSRPQQSRPTQVSQRQKGQEYRDWAAKLTGAGNKHRPKVGGNTAHHGNRGTGTGGSNPGSYGWNVPPKQPTGGVQTKPSAPDLATKTSATNVQSGWNPSGGYHQQPAGNPNYGQSNGYHPSSGHGYNPPVGGQGYPSSGGNNHYGAPPAYSPHGSPPGYGSHAAPPPYSAHPPSQPYNPYNPSYGHTPYSSAPGAGYNPPVGHVPQTILVQGGSSSRPGIGQLAKEAFVFAGVSAGVNAAVNRILPGGIYGNSHSGSSSSNGNVPAVAGPVSHTQITYNNYYNNGTGADGAPANPAAPVAGSPGAPAPAAPAATAAAPAPVANPGETAASASNTNASPPSNPAPAATSSDPQDAVANNNPSPLGFIITHADLKKLSEDLSSKETNNAMSMITMNLQGQKMDDSVTDDAPSPLMTVKDEAYELPTIKAVLAMHDNYELNVKNKEEVTPEERRENDELLDKILETEIMTTTMKFLSDKGYVLNDKYEQKDALKNIWFTQFKRTDGEPSSSGFETVFLAEQIDNEIIGLHNWIYFAKQEAAKKANYLGYIKQTSLGNRGAIVKMRSSLNDVVQPVGTIFVGTSPELEMALYTVCFYTRPNNPCPVTIGGTEFVIIANRVQYFGKDILVSAYPEI